MANPLRVLVVDDEGIIRDLARNALEKVGLRVLEARDGLEALECFTELPDKIDLVLLDMTMPRMGGAEAFRRIRGLIMVEPHHLQFLFVKRIDRHHRADGNHHEDRKDNAQPPGGFRLGRFPCQFLAVQLLFIRHGRLIFHQLKWIKHPCPPEIRRRGAKPLS